MKSHTKIKVVEYFDKESFIDSCIVEVKINAGTTIGKTTHAATHDDVEYKKNYHTVRVLHSNKQVGTYPFIYNDKDLLKCIKMAEKDAMDYLKGLHRVESADAILKALTSAGYV